MRLRYDVLYQYFYDYHFCNRCNQQKPLALTMKVKYVLAGTQEEGTKCTVEVFACKEFGIAAVFQS